MRQLLQDSGFNDEVVDARINEIIINGSNKDSNVAIKTYNELMKRVDGDKPNVVIVNTDKKVEFNKALEYLKKK